MKTIGLIPQRPPFVMVDDMEIISSEHCRTTLLIKEGNLLCDGTSFGESGVLEHIAQSAAAFIGDKSLREEGRIWPGYIGEIKKFNFLGFAKPGDVLTTEIRITTIFGDVTAIEAQTSVSSGADNQHPVASCAMKLFVDRSHA